MKNNRIMAIIVVCVLICILPGNALAMEKDDFFRYLINTSYPEAETNKSEESNGKKLRY